MPQKSKRFYTSVPPYAYPRLEESAKAHNVFKDDEEDETPNVSRFAKNIILWFLKLEGMEGMDTLKASDGSTTMDIIQRATHQFVQKNEDESETETSQQKRRFN